LADLVAGIVINKLSVRFEELDSKVGQMDSKVGKIAESIGHVVSDMLDPWRIIHTEDGSEREGESLKSTILKYYNIEPRHCMIVGNVHKQDSAITNAHLWDLTLMGLPIQEISYAFRSKSSTPLTISRLSLIQCLRVAVLSDLR
jgi:hypothetical protein